MLRSATSEAQAFKQPRSHEFESRVNQAVRAFLRDLEPILDEEIQVQPRPRHFGKSFSALDWLTPESAFAH